MSPRNFKIIEHTADIGVEVTGARLDHLFIHAAEAMFSLLAFRKDSTPARSAGRAVPVCIKAANSEELLVAWLNELLSLSAVKDVIFTEFHIATVTNTYLKGYARPEAVSRYRMKAELKAATYHQLSLVHKGASWKAKVIFDV